MAHFGTAEDEGFTGSGHGSLGLGSGTVRIALFSHDSVGLGHVRRNRAVAFSLARDLPRLTGKTVSGLLIAGNPEATRYSLPPGWDWVVLPGVAPADHGYRPRSFGESMSGLRSLRAAAIDAILTTAQPDLFIVDRHPFGVAGELTAALATARRHGCRTVLGLREVLDTPAVLTAEWDAVGGAAAVADSFDQVWLYGDSSVYDARLTGEVPAELARIAVATGYLSLSRPDPLRVPADQSPFVLTVLGGGSDGGALARTAIRAEPPAGHRHLVVTGPQMDRGEADLLAHAAHPRTQVIRHSDDVPGLIASASAVVCMAGYNTLAEVMATSTPALVVPRVGRRAEQPRRAEALARAGAMSTRALGELTPLGLGEWFASQVGRSVSREHIDRSGLSVVPRLAAHLVGALPTVTPVDASAKEAHCAG
ncbi:putative glycosyltransferase [Brevibacterium sanguinis]|uniref:Glycosyltransferase n=2 Tax=Brevibacterium TaxID=1696 RepID=A0ABX9GQS2_9MICO|nr:MULTISPECIES: glycosyltransferase [Brevibacterium]RBP65678.1 putative glycosyltransferase [Brevibacterium sanguinis]RBP72312.1 putative glycosyltransferase [Brevibacterium celere]